MKYIILLLLVSVLQAEITITGSNLEGCSGNKCYKQELLYKYTPPTPTPTPFIPSVQSTPSYSPSLSPSPSPSPSPSSSVSTSPSPTYSTGGQNKESTLVQQSIKNLTAQIAAQKKLLKNRALSSRKKALINKTIRTLSLTLSKKKKYLKDVLFREAKLAKNPNYKTLGTTVDLSYSILSDEAYFLGKKLPINLEYLAPQEVNYSLIGQKVFGDTGVLPIGTAPGTLVVRATGKVTATDSNGVSRDIYSVAVRSDDKDYAMVIADGDYYKDLLVKKGVQVSNGTERTLSTILAPYIDPASSAANPRLKIPNGGFFIFFEFSKDKTKAAFDFQDYIVKVNSISPVEFKKECLVQGYNGLVGDPIDVPSVANNLGHRSEGAVMGTSPALQYVYGMPGIDVKMDGNSQIKQVTAAVYVRRDVDNPTHPVRWDGKYYSLFWSTRQNWVQQNRVSDGQLSLQGLDNIPSFRTDAAGDVVPDMTPYAAGPYITAFNKTYDYYLLKFDLSSLDANKRTLPTNDYTFNLVSDVTIGGVETGWAFIGKSSKLVGPYNTDTQFSTIGGITPKPQDYLSIVRANTQPQAYQYRSALTMTVLKQSCDQ